MADEIYAAMNLMQASLAEPMGDAPTAHADGRQLRPGDEAALPLSHPEDGQIHL